MATLNFDVVKNPFVAQNLRGTVGRYTGPASYANGTGDSLISQEVKLGQIAIVLFEPITSGGTRYNLSYDIANAVVRWYDDSDGTEIADTTDLSGVSVRFLAVGS